MSMYNKLCNFRFERVPRILPALRAAQLLCSKGSSQVGETIRVHGRRRKLLLLHASHEKGILLKKRGRSQGVSLLFLLIGEAWQGCGLEWIFIHHRGRRVGGKVLRQNGHEIGIVVAAFRSGLRGKEAGNIPVIETRNRIHAPALVAAAGVLRLHGGEHFLLIIGIIVTGQGGCGVAAVAHNRIDGGRALECGQRTTLVFLGHTAGTVAQVKSIPKRLRAFFATESVLSGDPAARSTFTAPDGDVSLDKVTGLLHVLDHVADDFRLAQFGIGLRVFLQEGADIGSEHDISTVVEIFLACVDKGHVWRGKSG